MCPVERKLRHCDPHLQRQKASNFRFQIFLGNQVYIAWRRPCRQSTIPARIEESGPSEMCSYPENYPSIWSKPRRTKSDNRPAPMFPWNINTTHGARGVTRSISRFLTLSVMWIPGKFPGCNPTERSLSSRGPGGAGDSCCTAHRPFASPTTNESSWYPFPS